MKLALFALGSLLVVAAGYEGGKSLYKQAEVQGCVKTVLYDIQAKYGDIPDDIKAKIVTDLNKKCPQIL